MLLRTFRAVNRAAQQTCLALAFTVTAFASLPASALKSNPKVAMTILVKGKPSVIEVELYAKETPKTVEHFLDLVNKKFYDGILIHRYSAGFVAQAGDPKSKTIDPKKAKIETTPLGIMIEGLGKGGSGTSVPLEATETHVRGTLGLARSSAPDSGDSQFFFNLANNTRLDGAKNRETGGGYCAFGRVTKGLDVMDKLRVGDRIKTVRVIGRKKK